MSKDLRGDLEKWTPSVAPAWNPAEGEVLVGRVKSAEVVEGNFGQQTQAVIWDEDTGEDVLVYIGRKSLVEAWEKEAPKVGDRVGIKFHGAVKKNDGGVFYIYKVTVDHDAEAWTAPEAPAAEVLEGEFEEDDELPKPDSAAPAWTQGSLGSGGASSDEEDPLSV